MTNRQNEIIEKAIELIAENGIQGFTIKNLAKEIGVTEPAIYRHFESKTDILQTMLDNLDEATNRFTDEVLSKNYAPLKTLSLILKSYFKIFSEHPYWVAVIFADEIFKNDKTLSKSVQKLLSDKENTLPTYHEKIMIAKVNQVNCEETILAIKKLCELKDKSTTEIVKQMKLVVPEYISKNSEFEQLD